MSPPERQICVVAQACRKLTNPEQAWRMANDARADVILPVHFHTFHLSQEPSTEPIQRILNAAGASATDRLPLRAIGQTLHLG